MLHGLRLRFDDLSFRLQDFRAFGTNIVSRAASNARILQHAPYQRLGFWVHGLALGSYVSLSICVELGAQGLTFRPHGFGLTLMVYSFGITSSDYMASEIRV